MSGWVPSALEKSDGSYTSAHTVTARMLDETTNQLRAVDLNSTHQRVAGIASGNSNKHICHGCSKSIEGRVLEAMNQTWHPNCFTCSQCNREFDLSSGFTVKNNQPWCKKCVEWDAKERGVSASSSNSSLTIAKSPSATATSNNTAAATAHHTANTQHQSSSSTELQRSASQQRAHQVIQHGKTICTACGNSISGLAIGQDDTFFHESCFVCYYCQEPIDQDVGFVHKEDHIWHEECYMANRAPRCGACNEVLVGKFMRTPEGTPYHKECFVCNNCGGSVAAGYVLRDNIPYCAQCAKANPSSSSSSSTTTTTTRVNANAPIKQGIRIDPRTGGIKQVAHSSSSSSLTSQPQAVVNTAPTTTAAMTTTDTDTAQQKPKFCGNCGQAVKSKFCGGCGAKTGL